MAEAALAEVNDVFFLNFKGCLGRNGEGHQFTVRSNVPGSLLSSLHFKFFSLRRLFSVFRGPSPRPASLSEFSVPHWWFASSFSPSSLWFYSTTVPLQLFLNPNVSRALSKKKKTTLSAQNRKEVELLSGIVWELCLKCFSGPAAL